MTGCLVVFLFSPSLWERAGVRVDPLGFGLRTGIFVVFTGIWGSMTAFPAGKILKRVQDDRLFGCLVVWLFGCFGLVFLFSPSLWERAGVRVCPLGFGAPHQDFCCFYRDLGFNDCFSGW